MTTLEEKILTALTDLERTAGQMRTASPKPDLQALFVRLDALAKELPRGTDPDLLHYLHKKSYQKARLLLEGRDKENARGRCE